MTDTPMTLTAESENLLDDYVTEVKHGDPDIDAWHIEAVREQIGKRLAAIEAAAAQRALATPGTYHPDPAIDAEVRADGLEAERADLAAGYPPRWWVCPQCGRSHQRGWFMSEGVHRCMTCGYQGDGGTMHTNRPEAVTEKVLAHPLTDESKALLKGATYAMPPDTFATYAMPPDTFSMTGSTEWLEAQLAAIEAAAAQRALADHRCGLRTLDEALNSGDGSYKP